MIKKNYKGNYYYQLKQIDFDGSTTYSEKIAVNISTPVKFMLSQNYPNPLFVSNINSQTYIQYQLPREERVEIKIYDLMGREVKTLISQTKLGGIHTARWDGRNNLGFPL